MSLDQLPTIVSEEAVHRFQSFFEVSDDAFAEYDRGLRYKAINAAGAALLKLQVADAISRTPQELMEFTTLPLPIQRVLTQIAESVEQVFATAQKLLITHPIPSDEGIQFYETAYTPIVDGSGRPISVFSIGRKLTLQPCLPLETKMGGYEVKQAETNHQAPSASPQSISSPQSILDNLPQCIFWKNSNSVYLGCNQSWANVVGVDSPKDIIGKTDHDLPWIEGEATDYQERDRHVITTGKPELSTLTSRRKVTGEQLWFNASKVPLQDAEGQTIGLLCSFESIPERTQQAEKLSKSVELLQLVLDNIPQAIFWKDRNSVYLGCNQNWAQAAGIRNLEDVIGKTDFELFWTPEEAQLYYKQDQNVMETTIPVLHLIEHRIHADGTQAWIDVNKIPIKDAEGNVIGVLGTIEDISDRKQAEIALQQSEAQLRQQTQQLKQTVGKLQETQAQLVQTEKMSGLGQLVAGVAHEINNPVNFIHGNLTPASDYIRDLLRLIRLYQRHYPNPSSEIQAEIDTIDLEFLTEDLLKLLSSMRMGTERIKGIVLSLRNFSRIDEAEMKPVNIHEGIDSTLLILQSRLKVKQHHSSIQVIKEYGELPDVECYAGQLNQVFMNIINNAIDALEEHDSRRSIEELRNRPSLIRIRTERLSESHIGIRIQDNGPGMIEAVRKRLFDPFFTTKPVGKGTGLGLSISHQIIVNKHQGILKCCSEPGLGSEFWIKIPICQS
jgi:two-component system NtrC family sensor kinase